jgi:hypothetical protein
MTLFGDVHMPPLDGVTDGTHADYLVGAQAGTEQPR